MEKIMPPNNTHPKVPVKDLIQAFCFHQNLPSMLLPSVLGCQ